MSFYVQNSEKIRELRCPQKFIAVDKSTAEIRGLRNPTA